MKYIVKRLAFICKKCNDHIVNCNTAFKIAEDVEGPYINKFNMNFYCPSCNSFTAHYMVDVDISKSISLMNRLGYKTIYSCSGHYKEDEHHRSTVPYIMVKGDKTPNPDLVYDLVKAGFINWDIGQDKTHKNVDISEVEDVEELLKSTIWSFHWSIHDLKDVEKEFKFKYDPDDVIKYMRRYLKRINKKLNTVLEKHLKILEEKINDSKIQ